MLKDLPTCSPISINVDAYATNSISCEASILKDNVELRAQLVLSTSKYDKLVESHEKLSSSNDDLLASHACLKLCRGLTPGTPELKAYWYNTRKK